MLQFLLSSLGFHNLADKAAGKPKVKRDSHWNFCRKEFLSTHSICSVCAGRDNLEVHHILPVHFPGGKLRELDWSNLITLCRPHHLLFGHLMDWSSCNVNVIEDALTWLKKIEGRP